MTKTPIRRHRPGFGGSISADQIIKNLRANVSLLQGANIDSTVDELRSVWLKDYPNRKCSPFSKEDLFNDRKTEVDDLSGMVINNPNHKGTQVKFSASHGHWSLMCMVQPNGIKDFQFCVWDGNRHVFHPLEARAHILQHHDEETFQEWKRLVMSQWEEASNWLIQEARKAIRGYRAWSVTCGDSSERLMKNCPRVEVRNHVAFLYL